MTNRGMRIVLIEKDRETTIYDGLSWVFLKVMGKRPTKRAINEYLRRAWGIKSWTCIIQMSANAFKVGMKGQIDYGRIAKVKWDQCQNSVVVIWEWTTWKECKSETYSSNPIRDIFPNIEDDLWS